MKPEDSGFDLIHTYTRAEAIEDGVLVDVSETAREAGFRYPVALTRAVFEKCVAVPDFLEGVQDERGRLWDVLWVVRSAIRSASPGESTVRFRLYVRNTLRERLTAKDLVDLKAHCGPGDTPEPVVTIMLPEED